MIPRLKDYELFTYRNSLGMTNFEVTDEFVFICACDEIHQYCIGSTIPIVGKLGFSPTFGAFFEDKFFIGSKDSLYYFKYELYKLGDLNSLALCFFVNKLLVAVEGDKSNIQVFKVECDKLCKPRIDHAKHTVECDSIYLLHEVAIKSFDDTKSYGLCSAYCLNENLVYLGFESGTIVSFPASQLSNPNDVIFTLVITLHKPIITLLIKDSVLFALTITGIYKVKLDKPDRIDYFTSVNGKNLILVENLLVLEQEKRMLIFDLELNFIDKYTSLFDLSVCKVRNDSFYIGFTNGILAQYDLSFFDIHKKMIKSKEK